MRKPEQNAEPSIEEILASIRKIIADDGSQQPARAVAASETPPDAAPRRFESEPRRQPFQSTGAFYPEPEEPAVALGEDDILELTEDAMVEDDGGHGGQGFEENAASATPRDLESLQASMGGRSPPPSGEELESVLSNVVAEVKRLSGVAKPAADTGMASLQDRTEPTINTQRFMPPRPSSAAERPTYAAAEANSASEASVAPAAKPEQAPWRPAPASKPVWSARHLDSEGPRVRAPQPSGKKSEGRPASASGLGMTGPEGWAEGVQMPVPESGPAAPFPEPDADDGDMAPPLSGSGESRSEIEKEKTFVGEMLTRVFGGPPKKSPEVPPPVAPRLAKAADLAKATISDFASEKLRAPSVAQALHADQPFMDAITESLATAIADTNAAAGRSGATPAPVPEDELPEMLLPADDEIGIFNTLPELAPRRATGDPLAPKPAAAPPRGAASFAPPELPRDLPDDAFAEPAKTLRQTHSEIFGSGSEPDHAARAAPPARATPQPEPAASVKPAPAPASDKPAPGIAFPAGLEDSIKEMIKPLIVQWLNDNLPRIVERAVREEIADHGLVSRARGESGSRH